MPKKIDLTGQRFGRLLYLEEAGRNKWGAVLWKCLCDCGTIRIVRRGHLRIGHTKSCGCLQKEVASKTHYKHGLSYTKKYNKQWQKANRDKCNAIGARYKAMKRDATPHDANMDKINLYYQECAALNETFDRGDFEVDHIQPLSKGGLHHEDNLQILGRELNQEKKAKWPLTPEEKIKYGGLKL